ncbi:hypothetical protein HN51_060808 [Arachis hypogaea]
MLYVGTGAQLIGSTIADVARDGVVDEWRFRWRLLRSRWACLRRGRVLHACSGGNAFMKESCSKCGSRRNNGRVTFSMEVVVFCDGCACGKGQRCVRACNGVAFAK